MTEPVARLAPIKFAVKLRRNFRRLLFLTARSIVRLSGVEYARAVGAFLGEVQFRLAWREAGRYAREIALVLGRDPADPSVKTLLRQAYRISNAAVLEVLALFNRPLDVPTVAARCELRGLEHLEAALAGGRGAILLGSHMGNGALFAVRLAHLGLPVSVVYRQSRMMSADLFEQGYARYGVDGISANQGAKAYRRMLLALRKGGIVFMMIDQGVRHAKDGVVMRFLGKDMPMPAGPAQLARQSQAPLLPVATTAAHPVWRFDVGDPVLRVDGASLESDLEQLLRITEAQVLQYPQLWSWHHRRWRKYPVVAHAVAGGNPPSGD